jgi:Glycosyltransferase like family
MIHFICCSISPYKADRLRASIKQGMGNANWQLTVITDAKSLCEGYNRGLTTCDPRAHYVVLLHDDITFLAPELAHSIETCMAHYDVMGVAGTRKLRSMAWVRADHPHIFGTALHPQPNGLLKLMLYQMPELEVGGMAALDGCLLICRREVFKKITFDAKTFNGWHGYDIDFTYRAYCAGFRLGVTARLVAVHDSEGDFSDPQWAVAEHAFNKKHGLVSPPTTWSAIGFVQRDVPREKVVAAWPNILPALQRATTRVQRTFAARQGAA